MGSTQKLISWILLLSLFTTIQLTSSQPQPKTPPQPPPISPDANKTAPPGPPPPPPISPDAILCNGIFLSYTYTTGVQIKPNDTKSRQAYRFESLITVLNNGRDELKSWLVFVGFAHKEILVSASNAILADGSTLPVSVENGTTFAGFPAADLKSAIMTAGDITQMEARVELVGTQFGVAPPGVPLPKNITLLNDGWSCPKANKLGDNVLEVCCMPSTKNKTAPTLTNFLPKRKGDLTIMYDITRPYPTSYWAQVTIENHNPLGRLDNWELSFQWMKNEFIFQTKGAYPSVVDSSACINGPQGKYYTGVDFSNVLSCAKSPNIIDLPLTKYNDSNLGLKPYCCRNGTILSPSTDPDKSKSVFQMEVYKMPPDVNMSAITPPQSWRIKGNNLNPEYKCGPPVRVKSSELPDSSGLPWNRTAYASWQVVCNISQPAQPSCCVSFSSYLNDSIVPCKTCACGGCSGQIVDGRTCSTTSPALLLPPQALLIPFENRTEFAKIWAGLKHRSVPTPLPCGDNCGVSINWHLATDYRRGWSARITIFNWGGTNFADWSAAVELKNAAPDYEKAYSFNGTLVAVNGKNTTILMEGLPGLNYLVAEVDGKNPSKDYRVPGKQQSVISFTKKLNTKIKVGAGDGYPTKVFFNGQECSLPSMLPSSSGRTGRGVYYTFLLLVLALLILWV